MTIRMTLKIVLLGLTLTLSGCNVIAEILHPCTEAEQPRGPDTLEPNDTPETATSLETTLEAAFNVREVDIYRFEVQPNETITLDLTMLEQGNYPPVYSFVITGPNDFTREGSSLPGFDSDNFPIFSTTIPGEYVVSLTEMTDAPDDCWSCICQTRGSLYRLTLSKE